MKKLDWQNIELHYYALLCFFRQVGLKDCHSCHNRLSVESFSPSKIKHRDYECRDCTSKRNAEWRAKNYPIYKREYRKNNLEKIRLQNKLYYREHYGKGYWDKPRPFLGNQYVKVQAVPER